MADYNSVVLLGRLARDPEFKYVPGGTPVCTFSVATNQHYTKRDGQKAQTVTFVDVTVWRRLAELCSQFLRKGRKVLVSGSLQQDRWVDVKTQQPRSRIKVVAREVKFIGPRPEDAPARSADAVAEVPEDEASEA